MKTWFYRLSEAIRVPDTSLAFPVTYIWFGDITSVLMNAFVNFLYKFRFQLMYDPFYDWWICEKESNYRRFVGISIQNHI